MDPSAFDPKILEKIAALEEKYRTMGQDLASYLDGLLHSDYLTYWEYIHLDTLLTLQHPKTSFPDEFIFIGYHQITELYFRLMLWELDQVTGSAEIDLEALTRKLERLVRYFKHLVSTFDIMTEGMEKEQFLKFRMSLLPSSGFQSAQYRLIELASTDLIQLVDESEREHFSPESRVEEMIDAVYWQKGATELASGKQTLTLQQFREKYHDEFLEKARQMQGTNLWQKSKQLLSRHRDTDHLVELLRTYDLQANLYWPLAHYKSALKYLQRNPDDIAATGGTNWQRYLPPRFQRVIYFPELWSAQEKEDWGKQWVFDHVIPSEAE